MEKTKQIRAYMQQNKLDGVLISSRENMQWYTGFSGDTGLVLITEEKQYFITDFRYIEMAEKELGNEYAFIKERTEGAVPGLDRLMGKGGFHTLGIEMDKTTLTQKAAYDKGWLLNYKPVDAELKRLRQVKTADEIARMKEGAKIVEEIFIHMLNTAAAGMSEFDLLAEMQFQMNKRGATPSFDPIIASGPNSSLPHAVVTNRKIAHGDLLTMDFGVRYKGVCTDFTRTIAFGEVDVELKLIYNIVKWANLSAISAVKPGVKAADVDAVARNVIADHGYGAFYEHGTGHGVGVEIHEAPWLSKNSTDVLQPGMVLTIEPGIYLPGRGGVRIEDMLYVTEDGCENFYTAAKEFITIL